MQAEHWIHLRQISKYFKMQYYTGMVWEVYFNKCFLWFQWHCVDIFHGFSDVVSNIVCFVSLANVEIDARHISTPSMPWLHNWTLHQSQLSLSRAGGQIYEVYTKHSVRELYLRSDLFSVYFEGYIKLDYWTDITETLQKAWNSTTTFTGEFDTERAQGKMSCLCQRNVPSFWSLSNFCHLWYLWENRFVLWWAIYIITSIIFVFHLQEKELMFTFWEVAPFPYIKRGKWWLYLKEDKIPLKS
jgi:hypothetical protein